MTQETDDLDARLMAAGRIDELFARYRPILVARARARGLSHAAADDVVQTAMLRVWTELDRGKRHGVPIRVVFHMVLGWCVKGHFQGEATLPTLGLGEWDAPSIDDGPAGVLERDFLMRAFDGLAPRDRTVACLYLIADLRPKEIALRLGITRNAVDQALHRARRHLRTAYRA